MPSRLLAPLAALLFIAAPLAAQDTGLTGIIEKDAKVEKIATGLKFTEGPVWVPEAKGADGEKNGGYLLFSDIPADTIYKWIPGSGPVGSPPTPEPKVTPGDPVASPRLEVYLTPSRHANGLALDAQGRLIICEHERRLARLDPGVEGGRTAEPLAERFDGKRLNSPNDLAIAADGSIYFTDPPYGMRPPLGAKVEEKELEFSGVYRLKPVAGAQPELLVRDMPTPNGLAFSPDGTKLYIADTSRGEIRVFDLDATGGIKDAAGALFAEMKRPAPAGDEAKPARSAGSDGLKVDEQGNVYCAGSGGVWVFAPDGSKRGIIETPEGASNLCFGGPDNKVLYITARSSVYRIPTAIPGAR